MYELLPALTEQFAEVYPEIKEQEAFIAKVIQEEEAAFLRTLEVGLKKLEDIKQQLKGKSQVIPGEIVFELYDTFGFPLDLTALIAREGGLSIDEAGFKQEMAKQKERSKGAAAVSAGDWTLLKEGAGTTEFVGYDCLEAEAKIIKYRKVEEKKQAYYQIVLDKTPFYPEGGGQVGDTGYLEANGQEISIFDTRKENDLIIHFTKELPEDVTNTFHCVVNQKKRLLTQNNHTATHLLHAALREVLGNHVQQKGSLVNDQLLRFDFSHFAKMTDEELSRVEQLVNQKVRENIQLEELRSIPIDEAKAMGATALFGEKYGDSVRVIVFDKNYSLELCGGTHVPATGNIGYFKILSESSVAAGVRRIEAITADAAEAYVNEQLALIEEVKEALKNPNDVKKAIETLVSERNQLSKEVEALQNKEAAGLKEELLSKAQAINGTQIIVQKVKLPNADALKKLSFEIRNEQENVFVVLAADINSKPQISVIFSDNLVSTYNLNAGALVRELAKEIKGGGGGQPFFATAGGSDLSGLDGVVEKAREIAVESLKK